MALVLIALAVSVVSGVAEPFTSNLARDPESTFKLDWSLTNTGSLPLTFFIWGTPFDNSDVFRSDLFDIVTADRISAIYVGASAKRVITESAFRTLQPNETVHSTLNLLNGYYFPHTGDYELSYYSNTVIKLFIGSELPELTSVDNFRDYNLNYFTAYLPQPFMISVTTSQTIPNVLVPPSLTPESGGILEFIDCTQSQQDMVNAAHPNVLTLLSGVQTYLASDTCENLGVYQAWFGACDATRFATIKNDFNAIADRINQGYRIQCGGDSCDATFYSFVQPADTNFVVHLCDLAFSASTPKINCKESSLQGIIIHELSHFISVAGTLDVIYGSSQCIMEAQSDPASAVINADSHEFLAESCPGKVLAPTSLTFTSLTNTILDLPINLPITLPFGQKLKIGVKVTSDSASNPSEGVITVFAKADGLPPTAIATGAVQTLGNTMTLTYPGKIELSQYQISALYHNFFGTQPWLSSITSTKLSVTSDLTSVTFSNPTFSPQTAYFNQYRSITVNVSPANVPTGSTFQFFYGPAVSRTAFNIRTVDTQTTFNSSQDQVSLSLGYNSLFSDVDITNGVPVWVQFTGAPTPGVFATSNFFSVGTMQVDPIPTYCYFPFNIYPGSSLTVEVNTPIVIGAKCAFDVDVDTYSELNYMLSSGGVMTYIDQDTNTEIGEGNFEITTQFSQIKTYNIGISQFKSAFTYYLDSGEGLNALSITVTQATTTTAFNSPPTSINYGDSLLFNIDVTSTANGDINTGTVILKNGATIIGQPTGYPVNGNKAIISISTQDVLTVSNQPYTLNVYYSDNSGMYKDSDTTSKPAKVTISKAQTITTFALTKQTSVSGTPISIQVNVKSKLSVTTIVKEGQVSIKEGTKLVGTAANVNTNGVATISIPTLEAGVHLLIATFGTSTNFLGSSTTVSLSVNVSNAPLTFETYTSVLKGSLKGITITNTFKNGNTPTKITTIAYKNSAYYNYAPQVATNPSSLQAQAKTTTTLTLSAASTKPIFLYCANWPKGTYTFSSKLTLRAKQSATWKFVSATKSTLTISSGVFNGILEIPAKTKIIGWVGVPTVKTTNLVFTLGA